MLIQDCMVGQEVKAKQNGTYGITNNGWVGTITKIEGEYIWVMGDSRGNSYEDDVYGYRVLPRYFTPYEEVLKSQPEQLDVSKIISEDERKYLLDSMRKLLDEYDYQYSDTGLNRIIDVWASNKAYLIAAFKKHPNYKEGKFLITFERSYERATDTAQLRQFQMWVYAATQSIELPEEVVAKRVGTENVPWPLFGFLDNLHNKTNQFLSEEDERVLKEMTPAIHPHAGQKMSRVVNKLLRYLGADKEEGYEREFAKYADALNPITVKQTVVLSLNPLDYFTMSFGNSWSSCHTIDKENKRNMPNSYEGMYSSGTMSYMLDETSMVLYAVDPKYKGNEYWDTPKVNRQMFHYGEEKLIQSRLYPQANDSNSSAYEPFRNIVQEIIATIFEFPNFWRRKKGTDAIEDYVESEGTHYRDYSNFEACSICWPAHKEMNEASILIGHDPICIQCGNEHERSGNISCCPRKYYCTECGGEIREEEVIWVDGKPYCRDHAYWCEICDEYHAGKPFTEVRGSRYCEKVEDRICLCPVCGEWEFKDNMCENPETKEMMCRYCFKKEFLLCIDCGKYFKRTSRYADWDWYGVCEDCSHKRGE